MLAAYVKYYPGLVIVALIALRRWRAVGGFVAAGTVIGLLDLRWLLGSRANMEIGIAIFGGEKLAVASVSSTRWRAAGGPSGRTGTARTWPTCRGP